MGKSKRNPSFGALVAVVVSVSTLTTGCFDRQELEQQAFVTSMGVDKAPDGLMDYTFQIALPKSSAGSSGGGSGGAEPLAGKGPITVRGKTVMDALSLANASVERTLTMTHLNTVIFGEQVAKDGLVPNLRPLNRFREFRRTIYVKVAKGTARDILMNQKPMLETTITRIADDTQNVGKRTGFSPVETHLHDLTLALQIPHQDAVLPVYAVNESVLNDPEGKKPPEGKLSSEPGQIVRSGGNPVEYIGGAVFERDKLVGYLDGDEMKDLRMLRGTLTQMKHDFPDPFMKGQTVSLSIQKGRAPRVAVHYSKKLMISVVLPLDADLVGVSGSSNYTHAQQRSALEKYVDAQLASELQPLLEKWAKRGVDIVPLSNSIRGAFQTDAAFVRYPWEQRLKSADIVVHPQVHIRRFGTQLAPIRERT